MFATPDQIVETVVARFNSRASEMGFGFRASAYLPVKVADIKEASSTGSDGGGRAVSNCRHLCIYAIAKHCVHENPFTETHRQLSYSAIAGIFSRRSNTIPNSLVAACKLLSETVYAEVYQSALDDLNEKGLELWRAKFTRVDCDKR